VFALSASALYRHDDFWRLSEEEADGWTEVKPMDKEKNYGTDA
jgi:hypothetical protein